MIKKYTEYLNKLNEEVGLRDIRKIVNSHKEEHGKDFEIWFHQDLDGVTSCIAMKTYLENYGLRMVDCHITQYGGIEYAIKNKKEDSMAVLVDFAHSKSMFTLATDHHDKQTGTEDTSSTYFKHTRSNVETISGEISPYDVFPNVDIELIKTVDSADFLRYKLGPEDVQNVLFSVKKDMTGERNRFLMGLVVNRLLLVYKNKRITVTSMDGKRNHINKNFLECLAIDSAPSLISMFNNIKHYMNNAVSLEWDRNTKRHDTPKRLATAEEITANFDDYVESRKLSSDVIYDNKYKILSQYGIGSVFNPGSYDRYVVFKNNPDAEFVCTIFPMGLIQVSCNPFKEKKLKDVNLGLIAKEVIGKFKKELASINVPLSDLKRINEDEISKMRSRYGREYEGIGFTFGDLKAFYVDKVSYLPNRKSGDMKTKAYLDLNDSSNQLVQVLKKCMDKPFDKWSEKEREGLYWVRISALDIIEANSGGHPSITNIQGLNYLGCRRDLLRRLFNTEDYTDVMKLIGDEFLENLRGKIEEIKRGEKPIYDDEGIEFKSDVANENLQYYLKDKDGQVKPVSREEFLLTGFNHNYRA
ncbi:DHH family phosphoesterase, partial [bacterium]|nr:DHH family phosphoesterase [bacterium]